MEGLTGFIVRLPEQADPEQLSHGRVGKVGNAKQLAKFVVYPRHICRIDSGNMRCVIRLVIDSNNIRFSDPPHPEHPKMPASEFDTATEEKAATAVVNIRLQDHPFCKVI
jgi:hypothetical protein